MIDILLALHMVGLMMGAGGGFGSMITMQEAAKRTPEQGGVLKTLGPAMARFSAAGLALMWLTGLSLVFVKFGGFDDLPTLFWAKMAFVTALTVCSILAHITYGQLKAGNVAVAKRLPVLGPLSGASSMIAVLFAVLSFH